MRICLIEERFLSPRTTGPSKHTNQLANALSMKGHEITIICESTPQNGSMSTMPYERDVGRLHVVQLESIGIGHQRWLKGLMKSIQNVKPDIVHCQGYRNLTSDLSGFSARINRIPFVLSPRGSLFGYSYRRVDSLVPVAAQLYDVCTLRITLSLASAIAVTSEMEKTEAISIGVPPEKVHLIPHGMAFPDIPENDMNLAGNPRLLTVGRITPRRNTVDIIQSMKYVIREFPNAVLYVAGDPIRDSYDKADSNYFERAQDAASDPSVREHVKMLGGVYGDELWRLYHSCDCYIYASDYDNFGFGLLEAAYFGLPIISTKVGVAPELVQDGRGGVLVDDHRPTTIAKALLDLLRNRQKMLQMGEHLRARARQYSIEENADRYAKLYGRLLV